MSSGEIHSILEKIITESKKGVLIPVYVKTGAETDKLVLEGDELIFYTSEIPEKGRANASLIRFFARGLGLPISKIDIVYGVREHLKKILVKDARREEIIEKLASILSSS